MSPRDTPHFSFVVVGFFYTSTGTQRTIAVIYLENAGHSMRVISNIPVVDL